MKKIISLFLAVLLVLSVSGCGIKQKIQDKIGEKIGEKVLEKVTDSKVDVQGDKITVKGEDGKEVSMGGTEWPEKDIMKDIPKFEKGTIDYVTESEDLIMILINEVKKEDYEKYFEKIKEIFAEESYSMDSDGISSYGAGDGKGRYFQISYSSDDSTLSLNVSKKAE